MATKKNTSVPARPESTAPAAEKRFPMGDPGMKTVRAVLSRKVPAHVETDQYGCKRDIPEQIHVCFVNADETPVRSTDDSAEIQNGFILRFDTTDKALQTFARGINLRSGYDLGNKLRSIKLPIQDLKLDSVYTCTNGKTKTHQELIIGYAKKYPVKMRYDFRYWVDEESGKTCQTKYPVLFLWEQSDFDKNDSGWAEIE